MSEMDTAEQHLAKVNALWIDCCERIGAGPGFEQFTALKNYAREAIESQARCITEMLEALRGVVRVADRATDEFDAARAAIANAGTGGGQPPVATQPCETVPIAEYEQHLELATELEREGVRQVIGEVDKIAQGRTDTYWAAHSNACEEILHRLQAAWSATCEHCATQGLPDETPAPRAP